MGMLTIGEIAEMMDGTVIDGDPCLTINDYSYSSKDGDSQTLFLPVVGERTDAHDYIADALSHGMVATTTERGCVEENTTGMTYIAIDNTRDAIQRLGRRFRSCFKVPAVGITGSVGKTSTKEMIAAALETSFSIIKTEGNKNGQLGVPLMVLKMDEDTECLVLEMGVSLIGEMPRLSAVARPTTAVVTNIGVSHIGNFGAKEYTRREKLAIVNEMDEDGILLLNGEDELLAELAPGSPNQKDLPEIELYDETREAIGKIIRYSYGVSSWCDFRAEEITVTEDGVEFDFVYKDYTKHVKLGVFGDHNVHNAVAALSVAYLNNADMDKAIEGLLQYRPIAMRGGIELLDNGIYLVDDSYNASPDSMKSGIEILKNIKTSGRKIAVLADMLELGEFSEESHRLVGTYVLSGDVDCLVTIGEEAKYIESEVKDSENIETIHFEDRDEATEYLLSVVKPGDAVLCKGSRGMGLDKIAKAFRDKAKEEL